MKFEKIPPELVTDFDRALLESGGDRRQMFGCPCGFEGGQLFCGVFGRTLFVRLPEKERDGYLAKGATPFEPMPGRRMREYVVLTAADAANPRRRAGWFRKARAYAATLPPKLPRRAKGASRTASVKGTGARARRGAPR